MNNIARTFILVASFCTSVQAAPNFKLVNNTPHPVHFVVTGANDLFGLRNGQIKAPGIITRLPGATFEDEISLTGILIKGPQLNLFPNPQGIQRTVEISIRIPGQEQKLHMPVGAHRIFDFDGGKPIAVELVPLGDDDVTLRPLSGVGGCVQSHEIKRSISFEQLNNWALDPSNTRAYREFQEYVYPFVNELVNAGSRKSFFWNWPAQGIPWALKMKWTYYQFIRLTGIEIVPAQEVERLSKGLGSR